eukprot:4967852-Alexandrium_andersonii.AAC.1
MSASLVGSEMCIRDRGRSTACCGMARPGLAAPSAGGSAPSCRQPLSETLPQCRIRLSRSRRSR